MALSSAILQPFWASRACPKSAKICQDGLLAIFLPRVAPKSFQTPSRHRFFSFQNRFFKLSGHLFSRFSLLVSTFLHGLPNEAKLEREGAAVLAAWRLRYARGTCVPRLIQFSCWGCSVDRVVKLMLLMPFYCFVSCCVVACSALLCCDLLCCMLNYSGPCWLNASQEASGVPFF